VSKEIYEVLGRPVTKEQYEEASKRMDTPQSKVEEDMDEFAKRSKERAAQRMTPVKKAKGGTVSASKRADGCALRGKTRGKMV
jgi:hypothetical protein